MDPLNLESRGPVDQNEAPPLPEKTYSSRLQALFEKTVYKLPLENDCFSVLFYTAEKHFIAFKKEALHVADFAITYIKKIIADITAPKEKITTRHENNQKVGNSVIDKTTWSSSTGKVVTQTTILKPEKELLKTRLENQLELYKRDPRKYAVEIKYLESKLHQFDKKSPEWGDSNYFRDLLKRFQQSKLGNAFERAKASYLPIPINMRWQEFEAGEKRGGAIRVGVISDMMNGFTNLRDLKKMKGDEALRKATLQEIVKKTEGKKGTAQDSADYAIKELNNLDTTTRERRLHLQLQFMGIVELHLAKNPPSPGAETFKIAHVALLNQKSKGIDGTGWNHDEENEMLDMAEIFKEFDGKELIFDDKGPAVDEEGNLHMPRSMGSGRIKLDTLFVNTSVQGNTNNEGTQREINLAAHDKLNPEGKQRDVELNNLLLGNKSSYDVSGKMISKLHDLGFNMSCGCLSAKDRTGLSSTLFTVEQAMAEESEKFKREAVKSAFDKEGAMVSIAEQNSKTKTLKVSAMAIPHVTTEGAKGKLVRARILSQSIPEVVKENVRNRMNSVPAA